MPNDSNGMFAEYTLECAHCGWTKKQEIAVNAGLKVGDVVPPYPGDTAYGKCNRCKRKKMVVKTAPVSAPPKTPTGFWRIPQT